MINCTRTMTQTHTNGKNNLTRTRSENNLIHTNDEKNKQPNSQKFQQKETKTLVITLQLNKFQEA